VKGSKTSDMGTVALQTTLGSLEVSSVPNHLAFAVRTADNPMGLPVRSGRTQASLDGVLFGDYVVTFTRPECHDHVEKVTVRRGARSPVATRYEDGSLELTSDPSGAWVDKDGTRLGTTPITIRNLTPKRADFLLTLPGYDPTPVTCEIPEGETLKLDTMLLRKDRVLMPSEVKTMPVGFETPQPVLTDAQRKAGAEVLVAFTVQLDGSVSDVVIEKASDDDVGRLCQAAVEHWRFSPGRAPDDRIVDVRMEMPLKFPPQE
jgi:TonB family protein